MLQLVAQNDAPNVFRVFFIFKLRRVNPDDYKLVWIFMFEALEVRNYMDAVDAAVGPEVEKHYFAFERGERKWLVGIKPAAATGQFRGPHANFFLSRHDRTLP